MNLVHGESVPWGAAPTERGAVLSANGLHRYRLWRRWDEDLPVATYVMLNPSTANGDEDDATVRRCVGFASRLGLGGIEVVNLFCYRATSPKDLLDHVASLRREGGPGRGSGRALRNAYLVSALLGADGGRRIVAWGGSGGAVARTEAESVRGIIRRFRVDCLGTTAGGDPRHPSRLPYATELVRWRPYWEGR